MASYVTKDTLRKFATEISAQERVQLRRRASGSALSGTTFLSHSSKDDDLVVGAIRILEGHGARVYVDKKDPLMPPYTNSETARKLKDRGLSP